MQNPMCASSSDAKLGCALHDVFAVHSTGESLVLHLLLDAGNLDVRDGLAGLDQGAGG
ncbi:MAG: hypothetical protein WDM87_14670 [Terracidiphilus sp.]